MNIQDHISESLETIFCVKILKFLDGVSDPGWMRDPGKTSRIRNTCTGAALSGYFELSTVVEYF